MIIDYVNSPPQRDNDIRRHYTGAGYYSGYIIDCDGKILQLDNFRKLTGHGWKSFRGAKSWRQDKGQRACAAAFMTAVRSGAPSPIPASELFEVARVTLAAAEQVS